MNSGLTNEEAKKRMEEFNRWMTQPGVQQQMFEFARQQQAEGLLDLVGELQDQIVQAQNVGDTATFQRLTAGLPEIAAMVDEALKHLSTPFKIPACECGAAATGCGPYTVGHSSYCPVKSVV
jgi:hypothetical protein